MERPVGRGDRSASKRIFWALVVSIGGQVLGLGVWKWTYPSDGDPRGLPYVAWKAGIWPMDLDRAAGVMIADPSRDELVLGRTKSELRETFGYLTGPAVASAYLRGCYERSEWRDRDVLFIRKSPWMVVFDGEIAGQLVLIKGC